MALGPGVAGQSAAAGVAAFLTQYFAAINDHDYQAFSSLFEPRASPVQSDGAFRSGYRTSRDAGARLVALGRAAGGKWAASLTFDSQQDPAVSASRAGCTTWGVTFYLVPVGTSYLIGPPPPGYQASALRVPDRPRRPVPPPAGLGLARRRAVTEVPRAAGRGPCPAAARPGDSESMPAQ